MADTAILGELLPPVDCLSDLARPSGNFQRILRVWICENFRSELCICRMHVHRVETPLSLMQKPVIRITT
jgi:hypothetical protein